LTAQLECFEFLLRKKICTYPEIISKLFVDESLWLSNLHSFLHDHVSAKFRKTLEAVNKSSEKMYVCKEDKESLTKSKINLITQLFKYLLSLDDSSLKRHLSKLQTSSFKLLDFAIEILLLPMIHQLQILVED
jgi:hypothetical protein